MSILVYIMCNNMYIYIYCMCRYIYIFTVYTVYIYIYAHIHTYTYIICSPESVASPQELSRFRRIAFVPGHHARG